MLFCTIDVKALYPSIPYDGGLRAIEKALESRGDKSVSTKSLLNLAEIVLKNNYFEHNGTNLRLLMLLCLWEILRRKVL